MSSNEDSDDEFQSADEDIEFEPHSKQGSVGEGNNLKSVDLENFNANIEDDPKLEENQEPNRDQHLPQLNEQSNLRSVDERQTKSIVSADTHHTLKHETQKPSETIEASSVDKLDHKHSSLIKDEAIGTDTKKTDLGKYDENKAKDKTQIKGRKVLRKADRLREPINIEESEEKENTETTKVLIEDKEMSQKLVEQTMESYNLESQIKSVSIEGIEESIETKDIKTTTQTEKQSSYEKVIQKSEENETKEKGVIKGRKLIRKSQRLKEEPNSEDSEVLEEKKIEVLNKLSNLGERDDNSSKWNNWFTDIKSAAMTATSTTVSHVSQASNKWSLNPKSLITSAVSITSNVGSGINSVVENVSSVVDSAIGAPPPEQMAALFNKNSRVEKTTESDKQNTRIEEEIESKSNSGFGLFDYTLNTLESIGKKTMEVIVDDKHKRDIKTDKMD